ncbi:protein FAM163B [Misgurnus anguillicaudatus]|uniref:protein FAM163B n=1 Tax=Misgurnus anguillicaudatus TaxID=75329 RepID=UPI003CCEF9E6
MTAGTVVITGGILAAIILLTIVTVLCYCRLQYYCCRREESEGGEEEEADVTRAPPTPPRRPSPPESPLSLYPFPEYASTNQLLMTAEPFQPNGPLRYPHYRPRRSYTFCPSCSGYLPLYVSPQESLRNGGGRICYGTQEELNLPMDTPSFNKIDLFRSVTMQDVLSHHSISTDV